MAYDAGTVEATLAARIREREFREFDRRIARIERQRATATIGVRIREQEVKRAERRLKELSGRREVQFVPKLDLGRLTAIRARLTAFRREQRDIPLRVRLEHSTVIAARRRLRDNFGGGARSITQSVRVELQTATKKAVKDRLARNFRDAIVQRVRVEADERGAVQTERRLAQVARARDRLPTREQETAQRVVTTIMGARVDTTGFRAFERENERADDASRRAMRAIARNADIANLGIRQISGSARDAGQSLDRMDRPGRGRNTRGLFSLLGAGAVRSVRAVEGADRAIVRFNRNVLFLRNTIRLLRWPAIITGAGLAAQALSNLGAAAVALASSLAPLSGLLAALPAGLALVGQTVATTMLGFKNVGQAIKDVFKAQEGAADDATDAAQRQQSAAESVADAARGAADADREARSASDDLTKARAEARREIVNMRLELGRLKLAEEGAVLGLEGALGELEKLQQDPTAGAGELAQARFQVRAERAALRDARRERRDAERQLGRTERAQGENLPQVTQARERLSDAERRAADAARQLERAERDAAQSTKQIGTAAQNAMESLAHLSPAGRRFVQFIVSLRPRVRELQATAQRGLLPGVERGIRSAMRNFGPLNRVVGVTSRVLGQAAERMGRFFGSRAFGRDLELIGGRNARVLERMGRASVRFASATVNVIKAAGPFLNWLSLVTLRFSRLLDSQSKTAEGQGKLARFFRQTRNTMERLGSIAQSVGDAFLHIGQSARKYLGNWLLKELDASAQKFENWTEKGTTKNNLRDYFIAARKPLRELGRLLVAVVGMFARIGVSPGLTAIYRQLREELLPALEEIILNTTRGFGPALIDALTAVIKLFASLSDETGPLTAFIETITKLVNGFTYVTEKAPITKKVLEALFVTFALYRTLSFATSILGIQRLGRAIAGLGAAAQAGRAAEAAGTGATLGQKIAMNLLDGFKGLRGKISAAARRAVGGVAGIFTRVFRGAGGGAAEEGGAAVASGLRGRIGAAVRRGLGGIAGIFRRVFGRAGEAAAGEAAGGIAGGIPGAMRRREGRLGGFMTRWGTRLGKIAGRGLILGIVIGLIAFHEPILEALNKVGDAIDNFFSRIEIKYKKGPFGIKIPVGLEMQSQEEQDKEVRERVRKQGGLLRKLAREGKLTGSQEAIAFALGQPRRGARGDRLPDTGDDRDEPRKARKRGSDRMRKSLRAQEEGARETARKHKPRRAKTQIVEVDPVVGISGLPTERGIRRQMARVDRVIRREMAESQRLIGRGLQRWRDEFDGFRLFGGGRRDPLHMRAGILRSRDEAREAMREIRETIINVLERVSVGARQEGEETGDQLARALRSRVGQARRAANDMRDVVVSAFQQMQRRGSTSADRLADNMSRSFQRLPGIAGRQIGSMLAKVADALGALGASGEGNVRAAANRIRGGGERRDRRQRGGMISGHGRQDTEERDAMPGDFIATRHQQQYISYALANSGERLRFARGGRVPIVAAPGEVHYEGDRHVPKIERAMRTTFGYGLGELARRESRPHAAPERFQGGGTARGTRAAARRVRGKHLSLRQLESVAAAVGFANPRFWARVAYAESGGDVTAVNPTSGASGLWQVLPSAHPQYDVDRLRRDPYYNARAAFAISGRGSNVGPWEASRGEGQGGGWGRYLGPDGPGGAGRARRVGRRDRVDVFGPDEVERLGRPEVTGRRGAMRDLVRGALDTTRRAGNRRIDRAEREGVPAGEGVGPAGGPGGTRTFDGKPVARWIIPILQWARRRGWGGGVNSGFRTNAEQRAINRSGAFSAPAGRSNHEGARYPRGAVDVSDPAGLLRVLRGYKGKRKLVGGVLGPIDPWHFSATGRQRGGFIGRAAQAFQRGGFVQSFQRGGTARDDDALRPAGARGRPTLRRSGKTKPGKKGGRVRRIPDYPEPTHFINLLEDSFNTKQAILVDDYNIDVADADLVTEEYFSEDQSTIRWDQVSIRVSEINKLRARIAGVLGELRHATNIANAVLEQIRLGLETREQRLAQVLARAKRILDRVRSLANSVRNEEGKKRKDKPLLKRLKDRLKANQDDLSALTGSRDSIGAGGERGEITRGMDRLRTSRDETVIPRVIELVGAAGLAEMRQTKRPPGRYGGLLQQYENEDQRLQIELGGLAPGELAKQLQTGDTAAEQDPRGVEAALRQLLANALRERDILARATPRVGELVSRLPRLRGGGVMGTIPGSPDSPVPFIGEGGEVYFDPKRTAIIVKPNMPAAADGGDIVINLTWDGESLDAKVEKGTKRVLVNQITRGGLSASVAGRRGG